MLLGNDRDTNETTAIAMQQLRIRNSIEPSLDSGLRATIEVLLEVLFSMVPLR
jgi:hypothetical protein